MRRIKTFGLVALLAAIAASPTAAIASCTLPYNFTNGQPTDATQVMANYNALLTCLNSAPGGSTNALQFNSGSGFGGVGPLTNGQLVIGSTSGAPQAGVLTPGAGISIANGPGSITISAGTGTSWPAFQPPTTSMFPTAKTVGGITGHQSDDTGAGYLNYIDMSTLSGGDRYYAYVNEITNTGDWSATWRMTYSGLYFNYWSAGLVLYKDGASNIALFGVNYTSGVNYGVLRYQQNSPGFVDSRFMWTNYDQGNFLRVTYTAGSDLLEFYFSRNGKIWMKIGSVTATSLLGGPPDRIGFGSAPNAGGGDFGQVGFNVDYWNSDAF